MVQQNKFAWNLPQLKNGSPSNLLYAHRPPRKPFTTEVTVVFSWWVASVRSGRLPFPAGLRSPSTDNNGDGGGRRHAGRASSDWMVWCLVFSISPTKSCFASPSPPIAMVSHNHRRTLLHRHNRPVRSEPTTTARKCCYGAESVIQWCSIEVCFPRNMILQPSDNSTSFMNMNESVYGMNVAACRYSRLQL